MVYLSTAQAGKIFCHDYILRCGIGDYVGNLTGNHWGNLVRWDGFEEDGELVPLIFGNRWPKLWKDLLGIFG